MPSSVRPGCLAALLVLATLLGCKGAPSAPDASAVSPPDSGEDSSDVGTAGLDAAPVGCVPTSPTFALLSEIDDADAGPSAPLAPADQGGDQAITSWVMAMVDPAADQVGAALDFGTFQVPAAGATAYGVTWTVATTPDAGPLPPAGDRSSLVYAAATVNVQAAVGLSVRADRAYDVYVNGRRQPGDVYGSGRLRVPFHLEAGANTVVIAGAGGQATGFGIGLTTSSHEALFNTLDPTFPDLRVGERIDQWLGVPVQVFGPSAALDVMARVIEDDHFRASAVRLPALAGGAVTQVPFLLKPKQAPAAKDETWTAQVQIDSRDWSYGYRASIDLATVAADANFRGTFLSPDDLSVQFYGVRPPAAFDPLKSYALVLSLHGAGVDAFGQVGAYSSRDWNYVVAPTNRRPYGFDWEEWGRADAIFALDETMARFCTDPTQTYLTGHSMGGHGTWHVGVHHAGRFAMIGPSAGWNSFYTYTGVAEPTGPTRPARAHSKTTDFMVNLSNRAAYVIHGEADTNVPISEAKDLVAAASPYAHPIVTHWEPGADHWWDGDEAPGVDCVDWAAMFRLMQMRRLDPTELDFKFTSSAPWYSPTYSYLTFGSSSDPYQFCTAISKTDPQGGLALATTNARSMSLDGKALRKKGIVSITVDGAVHDVPDGPLAIGPGTGKRPHVTGPYNQIYYRPFLFVYPDGATPYADYASYLVSTWALVGNGHAGALPASKLTEAIAGAYNVVHLGRARADLTVASSMPFTWTDTGVASGTTVFAGASLLTVFDSGDRLGALLVAPKGKEYQLYWLNPFSSRSGLPDYFVWDDTGRRVAGYYSADWTFDAALGAGW